MALERGFNLLTQRQYQKALIYFQTAATNARTQVPFNEGHYNNCIYGTARALFGLKKYREAEDLLNSFVEHCPYWISPYRTLVRLYEENKAFDKAETIYQKGLNVFRDAPSFQGDFRVLQQDYAYFLSCKEQRAPLSSVLTFDFQRRTSSTSPLVAHLEVMAEADEVATRVPHMQA